MSELSESSDSESCEISEYDKYKGGEIMAKKRLKDDPEFAKQFEGSIMVTQLCYFDYFIIVDKQEDKLGGFLYSGKATCCKNSRSYVYLGHPFGDKPPSVSSIKKYSKNRRFSGNEVFKDDPLRQEVGWIGSCCLMIPLNIGHEDDCPATSYLWERNKYMHVITAGNYKVKHFNRDGFTYFECCNEFVESRGIFSSIKEHIKTEGFQETKFLSRGCLNRVNFIAILEREQLRIEQLKLCETCETERDHLCPKGLKCHQKAIDNLKKQVNDLVALVKNIKKVF